MAKRDESEQDITGDVGVVITGTNGIVHVGKGDVVQSTTVISGNGVTIVNGDHHGGIGRSFTKKSRKSR